MQESDCSFLPLVQDNSSSTAQKSNNIIEMNTPIQQTTETFGAKIRELQSKLNNQIVRERVGKITDDQIYDLINDHYDDYTLFRKYLLEALGVK